ncbi:hypothetical protein LZ31DRAFT_326395 [Colletotrichum somersetense]|nr:hypothetical protein LZ31DRAFT_326395 [Colletotrichum somersetense]
MMTGTSQRNLEPRFMPPHLSVFWLCCNVASTSLSVLSGLPETTMPLAMPLSFDYSNIHRQRARLSQRVNQITTVNTVVLVYPPFRGRYRSLATNRITRTILAALDVPPSCTVGVDYRNSYRVDQTRVAIKKVALSSQIVSRKKHPVSSGLMPWSLDSSNKIATQYTRASIIRDRSYDTIELRSRELSTWREKSTTFVLEAMRIHVAKTTCKQIAKASPSTSDKPPPTRFYVAATSRHGEYLKVGVQNIMAIAM